MRQVNDLSNFNSPKLNVAIGLIEFTICLFIMFLIFGFWKKLPAAKHTQDFLALQQLEQTLHLARSYAIDLNTKVHLCPTFDLKNCKNTWQAKIMLFAVVEGKFQLLYKVNSRFTDPLISFAFFGERGQQQKLTFLPNGTTINNGHICTKPMQRSGSCLYINQTGKTYILAKS